MGFNSVLKFFVVLFWTIIFGCTTHNSPPAQKQNAGPKSQSNNYHIVQLDECKPVEVTGNLVKKVDNFMIVFDPSASMTETYVASDECVTCHVQYKDMEYANRHSVDRGGPEISEENPPLNTTCLSCHQDYSYSKFKFAKRIAYCFNQTIPDLKLSGAIRTFGSPVYTMISHGPESYTKEEFSRHLRGILDADGISPLDHTLKAVKDDWFNIQEKIAIIIISDGKDMDERPVLAAEELKAAYGENICIYTIHIGNDTNGKLIMEKIAAAGQCGLAVSGDSLLNREKMDDFIREIFLKEGPPKKVEAAVPATVDSDGDGVPDDKDNCPETPEGLPVDENGCWKLIVLADVLFDFDKDNLKPEGRFILDKVVHMLNKYPLLKLKIKGHTDNFGSMEYNIGLSKRRAQAGLNYIIEKNIAPERLSMSWHSYSIPKATNETREGRALNRRIEFQFSK